MAVILHQFIKDIQIYKKYILFFIYSLTNQPLNIVIQFNKEIQYNYLNIGLLVGGIIGVIVFIIY
jgi:hypothetical protein